MGDNLPIKDHMIQFTRFENPDDNNIPIDAPIRSAIFTRFENLSETLHPLDDSAVTPPSEELPQPEWITPPHNHLFDPILPIIPPPLPPQMEKVYQDEFTFWKNQAGIDEDLLDEDDELDLPRSKRFECHCGNCMDCCTNGYRDFL